MPNDAEPILQAGAIPFRHGDAGLEFCLITSVKKGHWQFPKGIIDPGETVEETALKESLEEAGLEGHIVGQPVGTYDYAKWKTTLTVTVVLMEVSQVQKTWDEAEIRKRRWCTAEDVRRRVEKPELLELFEVALAQLEQLGLNDKTTDHGSSAA